MAKYEKQLTRMYDDGIERAVSVISKNVIHAPSYLLNDGDLMFSPGADVFAVQRVGEHLVAIKPYEIIVKHGDGNDYNSKSYKFDRTMTGNYLHVCNNNRDTILFVAYDSPVIKKIQITEEGITETNTSPFGSDIITNCACIDWGGKYAWWVFTTTHVWTSPDLNTWTQYTIANSSGTYNGLLDEIKKAQAVVSTYSDTDDSETVSDIRITIFFKVDYCEDSWWAAKMYTKNLKDSGTIYEYAGWRRTNNNWGWDSPFQTVQFIKKQSVSVYPWSTQVMVAMPMIATNSTLRIRYIRPTPNAWNISSTYPTGDSIANKAYSNITITEDDHVMLYGSDSDAYVGTICVIKAGTSKCDYYGLSSDLATATYLKTINLKASDESMFYIEPTATSKCFRRDLGDEKYNQTKCFYSADGSLEFYTGNYQNSGFLYTYEPMQETGSSYYDVRKRTAHTDEMKVTGTTNESFISYTGDGATETTDDTTVYINNKITGLTRKPRYINIIDTVSGMEAHMFPIAGYGIAFNDSGQPIMFATSATFICDQDTEALTYYLTIKSSNQAIQSSGVMNVSDRDYEVRILYGEEAS